MKNAKAIKEGPVSYTHLVRLMGSETTEIALRPGKELTIIMMAGLQGAGKTTTTAKTEMCIRDRF